MILGPTGQWPVISHPALQCQNISKNNTMRESFYLIYMLAFNGEKVKTALTNRINIILYEQMCN